MSTSETCPTCHTPANDKQRPDWGIDAGCLRCGAVGTSDPVPTAPDLKVEEVTVTAHVYLFTAQDCKVSVIIHEPFIVLPEPFPFGWPLNASIRAAHLIFSAMSHIHSPSAVAADFALRGGPKGESHLSIEKVTRMYIGRPGVTMLATGGGAYRSSDEVLGDDELRRRLGL